MVEAKALDGASIRRADIYLARAVIVSAGSELQRDHSSQPVTPTSVAETSRV